MGSKNKKKSQTIPFVSICTPTFNRRPFIPTMFQCFKNQTYPKHRMEWIIVDDGTDKIRDLVEASGISQIRYFEVPEKMTLGAKRNLLHKYVNGSIIVYMDDDDYYPPERVAHAVEKLQEKSEVLCAGSSEIYIYFKHIKKMIQCGPYMPTHATAGTFAFKRELLDQTRYNENASLAEEKEFLKNYTIPFIQLDPLKTILVFSHEHNTFDKRKLLDMPNNQTFLKESDKTIDMFIRTTDEAPIKKFFLKDIDQLLATYKPGKPEMKPDVLKQIKEIEKERDNMMREQQAQHQAQQNAGAQNGQIMMNVAGQEPRAMTPQEIITLLQQQQQHIQQLEMAKMFQPLPTPTPFSATSTPPSPPPPFELSISTMGQILMKPTGLDEHPMSPPEIVYIIQIQQSQIEKQKKEIETLQQRALQQQSTTPPQPIDKVEIEKLKTQIIKQQDIIIHQLEQQTSLPQQMNEIEKLHAQLKHQHHIIIQQQFIIEKQQQAQQQAQQQQTSPPQMLPTQSLPTDTQPPQLVAHPSKCIPEVIVDISF